MLDDDLFARLPPELRRKVMRGLLTELFGAGQAAQAWQQMEQVGMDRIGHADPPDRIAGGEGDPAWGGDWRVFDAE